MSDAATTSAPTTTPDPNPAGAAKPSRLECVLNLVRKLIDYGKEIATTLRERSTTIDLPAITRPFGTRDIVLILARITHGLLLANALEARLVEGAARREAEPTSAAPRAQQPRPRAAPAASHPAGPADSHLAGLPTPERIAAEVRRRPIGGVLVDICCDLGILPCHPLWPELSRLIIVCGGNLLALIKDATARLRQSRAADWPTGVAAASSAPAATGPP
jgi:hypothetical protein